MIYSEEFKEKVKKAFPNNEELHRRLNEENDEKQLTRFLEKFFLFEEDSQKNGIPFEEILVAESITMLQDKAKREKEKHSIYLEWCEIMGENWKTNDNFSQGNFF